MKTSHRSRPAEQAGHAAAIYASGLPQIYISVITYCLKKEEGKSTCPLVKFQSQEMLTPALTVPELLVQI